MNSKERVRAAIARQPVDRVPIGLYAVDHDTVAAVAWDCRCPAVSKPGWTIHRSQFRLLPVDCPGHEIRQLHGYA